MTNKIEEYKAQLLKVEDAIKNTPIPGEVENLKSLKDNLILLLRLTQEAMELEMSIASMPSCSSTTASACVVEDMVDIDEMESDESFTEASEDTQGGEKEFKMLNNIRNELTAMIGEKCTAPYTHKWGATTYYNGIVCGLDDTKQDFTLEEMKNFRLRVLFTNPTDQKMVPCKRFLEDHCKFDDDTCQFSHGELVPYLKLADYKLPDFEKLSKNCMVLAKMGDQLWHRGKVVCVNPDEKKCSVQIGSKHRTHEFDFEDLYPLTKDSDESSDSEYDTDENDLDNYKRAELIEKSLFTFAPNQALGEWEKNTRGIGSKLMAKMGYIHGNGLGSKGEGIVVPISAQIFPPGCSLDYCMKLKESGNGDKNLFKVEKKMNQMKKRQEQANARAYARESIKTDVFSFLNDSVLSTTGSNAKAPEKAVKTDYQNRSTKSLNVDIAKVADCIRNKNKEIDKIKIALKRQESGTSMSKRLQAQLTEKESELNKLLQSENLLTKERMSRKTKHNLSTF